MAVVTLLCEEVECRQTRRCTAQAKRYLLIEMDSGRFGGDEVIPNDQVDNAAR